MKKLTETEKSIAASLDGKEEIFPYLPELLSEFWEMGASVDEIIECISRLNFVKNDIKVLDLGCGKGRVTIEIAKRFGYHVLGVDAEIQFLKEAKEKAAEHNVESLCKFICEDMRNFVKKNKKFDIIVYASVGTILGSFEEIILRLRKITSPGGYIIIDDGYLLKIENMNETYREYLSIDEVRRVLEKFGDKIISEIKIPQENIVRMNEWYIEMIERSSAKMIACNPSLEKILKNYIENQKQESEYINKNLGGAVWVVQKN